MKKIAIRERLILYFVLLSILSIAIISLFSIFEARKGITHRTFSQLTILRDIRREQIITFYQTRCNELTALASVKSILSLAEDIVASDEHGISAQLMKLDHAELKLVADKDFCKSLVFLSESGQSISLTNDSLKEPPSGLNRDSQACRDILSRIKLAGNGAEFLAFEFIDPDRILHTLIAAPVMCREKGDCGVLVMEISPEAISRIIYRTDPGSGLGKTGEAYLVGSDGLMRSPSRFVDDAVMDLEVNTEGFKNSLAGKEGIGIYPDYRGIGVLGAYGQLNFSSIHQVILAEIDVSEAMVPLNAIRNEILMLSVILLLVIFFITWFLAYGITRPLIKLKNAANHISGGNYDLQLEIGKDDEIGDLTRAFNIMAWDIKTTTQELKENEERLRHFYQATLDGIILHENSSLVLFNSAIQRLTGYSANELTLLKVKDLLQPLKEARCEKDTTPRMYESMLIRKDGSTLPVEVQESCVDFEGKNIQASVIRDITTRKKMESELARERNKRIRAVFDGQDSEQQRLSRELHDGLGQQLVAGKLILESLLYSHSETQKEKIKVVQGIFDLIIGDIRRISHNLSPSVLHAFGLQAAMENLCNNLRIASGIRINLNVALNGAEIDEMTSTYLYRITQESLSNVQKHAAASEVSVVLKTDQGFICLDIEDNGAGFNLSDVKRQRGNGLYNIRERINILKGNFSIKSCPGHGTKIHITIPADMEPQS